MLQLQDCQNMLKTQFVKDFSQQEHLSKLLNDAWWKDTNNCLPLFSEETPIQVISDYLNIQKLDLVENIQDWISNDILIDQEESTTDHMSASIQNTSSNILWSITSSVSNASTWNFDTASLVGGAKLIWSYVLYFIAFILIFTAFKNLIKYIFRRGYAFLNANRMVYLKVILPRWDSKMDRDQGKEIAKDMKEKIWRMNQVYGSLSRLWNLSIGDKISKFFFRKPKVALVYHYQDGRLNFVVWIYPEYQKIIEAAVGSQYPESSIELTTRPAIFKKKYVKVMPLESQLDSVYTMKLFTRMSDDPINNLIDSIRNIPKEDTASIVLTIKPLSESWNRKARKKVDRLYKNLPLKSEVSLWQYFVFPWKIFSGLSSKTEKEDENVTMVRMVKAKEDAINDMANEAGTSAFESGLIVVSSSDDKERVENNIEWMISSFNVYNDEYSNELKPLTAKEWLLWFFYRPMWSIAARYFLTNLFYNSNIFTVSELSGLFHFPDGIYNRSNIIDWMQYKVLPAPSELPIFWPDEENGFVISWVLAEKYKWGKLSDILKDYANHWAVGKTLDKKEKLIPFEDYKKDISKKEIIEKDWHKYIKEIIEETRYGYKWFKSWVLLWVNIYRNKFSPVYMKRDDRTRHHYCIGKSGTGKSVFLQMLARQDMWNGDGLCVIDPHGDLVEELLAYVPKERAKDVIYFDAWDDARPMWLNLYEINSLDEADRTVNDATEIFIKMFGPEIFGPRIQEYFKYGSLTLMEDFDDRPTILDVTRLFTDDAYREFKVSKVTNPVVRNFWDKTYASMWDREKAEIIPYFSSKFVSFNTNRLIRNIIGQTKSAFNIEEIMNNKKILLINLSKGKIWELNAQLLGMILVSKIYNAAMWRAKIPKSERKDFYLYVDEFQNFVSNTFADILSEARKYRLSLIMAHQYIAQLDSSAGNNIWWWKSQVKDAVFGNVWTMQSFKVGAPDAEFLEKEYQPVLSAGDIAWIANYKAYVKLNINNSTSRVFSMNSIYTSDYENKKLVPILQEYCAKKYWRKRDFVDAEISARLWLHVDETILPTEQPIPFDWSTVGNAQTEVSTQTETKS